MSQRKPKDSKWWVDADEDPWAWRRALKSNWTTLIIYRTVVIVVGLAIVVLGVILLPFPGPGWLVIFLGLGVLASEFEPAAKLRSYAIKQVKKWNEWQKQQSLWVRALLGLGLFILIVVLFYALFAISGVPVYLPDPIENWLRGLPGLH
ncbi:uncharacterized protein (TIGR02611 family) [Branchiibius hedensis]|uniref:TIGR02611 family protein n=1 Tax=Branchiibius hedensis TaxID=672460 RepID=A0A2Y8ZPB1_9MICO|nr:TIGR02611 family protein [Branchiibius hedensis]PWJ24949.1 uncharacterized protein (TIGR02611 family) [Branchiibius hedensis]SSA33765.1 TIGR02611 family protein [Branchiibius hedensis]